MSSILALENRMCSLIDEENKYLNKLKNTLTQFGTMTPHGIQELISYCNIKLAQEELTNEIAKKKLQQQVSKI